LESRSSKVPRAPGVLLLPAHLQSLPDSPVTIEIGLAVGWSAPSGALNKFW